MILSYKYRLYPNKTQQKLILRAFNIHRGLYNDALTERRLAWEKNRKSISYFDQTYQMKHIRSFDSDAAWLSATASNNTLRRLDKAFAAFYRRAKSRKPGEKAGYPKYKGRKYFNSIEYKYNDGLRLKGDKLHVHEAGLVPVKLDRPIPDNAKIKAGVLKRDDAERWWIVLQLELPDVIPSTEPLPAVGIDMGLTVFAALSDGTEIENPRWFRVSEEKLAVLQKRLARCRRGSNQYRALQKQIVRLHAHIADQRREHHHLLSRKIVDQYPMTFVEDLNVKGLAQTKVAKSIGDAGWSQFLFHLKYKAQRAGGDSIAVSARNTSQECPQCGAPVHKSLAMRVHKCSTCGYEVSRDVAAAQVVLKRGLDNASSGRNVLQRTLQSALVVESERANEVSA